jgi:hypothetical protein
MPSLKDLRNRIASVKALMFDALSHEHPPLRRHA